jgi:hypothetical protein
MFEDKDGGGNILILLTPVFSDFDLLSRAGGAGLETLGHIVENFLARQFRGSRAAPMALLLRGLLFGDRGRLGRLGGRRGSAQTKFSKGEQKLAGRVTLLRAFAKEAALQVLELGRHRTHSRNKLPDKRLEFLNVVGKLRGQCRELGIHRCES